MKRTRLATIVLLGLLHAARAQAGEPYARQEGDLWVAGNDGIEISVNTRTGVIERLLDRVSKEDFANQTVEGAVPARPFLVGRRIGGISLFDELRAPGNSPTGTRTARSSGTGPPRPATRFRFPLKKHFPARISRLPSGSRSIATTSGGMSA